MAAHDDTIALNIRQCMKTGLVVYDLEGKKVGQVDSYEPATGYMMVRTNPFADSDLFIPFSAVSHIDPRELFVSETRHELLRTYANPPPRRVEVTRKTDHDTGENGSRTVITLSSGYDGTPIVVGGTNPGALGRSIAPGYEVYTSDREFVGGVSRYDDADTTLLVVAGQFHKVDMVIPLALVETVDSVKSEVSLAVSAADLRRFQREPREVVTVQDSEET